MTNRAARYLRESLTRKKEEAPEALRIVHTEDGFQLTLDDAKDGDEVFEQEGENYLLLDPQVSEALAEATVDAVESPQGMRLTLAGGKTPAPAEPQLAEPEPGPKPKP